MNASLLPRSLLLLSAWFATLGLALGATYSIADHGAVNDGKTINTAAIQATVDACAAAGGGTVLVPPGVWVTGSIQLKSHITLRLENGAVLKGSGNLHDYPPNGFKHPEMRETTCLLWAIGQNDVTLCGDGTIDLNDRPFFDWTLLRTGLPKDEDSQLADWQRKQCVVTALARPSQPLFFHECRHLQIKGITIRNSPCWTLVLSCCRDVQVLGARIINDPQVPNNDGIHISGSKNVVISNCIIRGGDDAIACTGITDPASVCEDIAISNCILTSRSAGLRIGYSSGKVRNVTASNLILKDCNRGILVQAGDGGWVHDVAIDNVVMHTRMTAGAWWGKGEPLVISAADSDSARISNIDISHVRASAENSILVVGRNHNVSNVNLDDWSLRYNYSPNSYLYGRTFDLAPAKPRPSLLSEGRMPWIYADSVAGLHLRDMRHEPGDLHGKSLSLEPVQTDVSP